MEMTSIGTGNLPRERTQSGTNHSTENPERPPAVRSKPLVLSALLAVACTWQPANADPVYRCQDRRGVVYTSEPTRSSCRRIHLNVVQPNPKELARLAEERERRALEEQQAEEQARAERLVRARELEAVAALRWARAAELEAQSWSSNCQLGYPPSVYQYYSVPTYWTIPRKFYGPPNFPAFSGRYRQRSGDDDWMTVPDSGFDATPYR